MTGLVERTSVALGVQPSLYPVQTLTGATVNYASQASSSWVPSNQQVGVMIIRSNATTAMSDKLPNPANLGTGDIAALPNGWNILVMNRDASASITVTPLSPAKINGATTLTITAGNWAWIFTDGSNYFALT